MAVKLLAVRDDVNVSRSNRFRMVADNIESLARAEADADVDSLPMMGSWLQKELQKL